MVARPGRKRRKEGIANGLRTPLQRSAPNALRTQVDWPPVGDTTFKDWKFDAGVGLRLAWNLSTVVSFDYAQSGERGLFYMELGHQF